MRSTNGAARRQAKKDVMKRVQGFRGARSRSYTKALEASKRAEQQAYIGRKIKKRDFRRLWITRLNIASRNLGMSYSRLIAGLQKADIRADRKQLSELAIHQPEAFAAVVAKAKAALEA